MLPSRRGVIRAISTSEDFAHVPGIIEVEMKLRPGDVVSGLMDSASTSGLIFVQLDDERHLDQIVKAVADAFYIEVDASAADDFGNQ